MNSKILKSIQSPFSDKLIEDLIKKYINYDCDENRLYMEINNLNESDNKITTDDLESEIKKKGEPMYGKWQIEDFSDTFLYTTNDFWTIISSIREPFKEDEIQAKTRENSLIYRIYLNLKDKDKKIFIMEYMKRCKENKIPYKFKFSRNDSRDEQIILLTNEYFFDQNIEIIESITQNMKFGPLPKLIGRYKNKIGIIEEYSNRIYSPIKVRLALISSSMKKYLIDHKEEFYDQLSNPEEIDLIEENFKYAESFSETFKFQKISSVECAKKHIESLDQSRNYLCNSARVLKNFNEVIQKQYKKDPEKFIKEISENYRYIGTQAWGISKNFLFSNKTEEKYLDENDIEI